MITYAIETVAQVLEVSAPIQGWAVSEVQHLLIDSRRVVSPSRSLYFALHGKNHDGHTFITTLYGQGVRNFVVSNPCELPEDANVLVVADTLVAFQKLAAWHRAKFHLPVIGVTGSNGKTIVKEWLYQLLCADKRIVRSPRSYNSQVGVPLSVWQIEPHHTLGIFEAGISQVGEMARLAPIIACDLGVFTMLGDAHSDGFGTDIAKLREKLILFNNTPTLFFGADDSRIATSVQMLPAIPNRRLITWAKSTGASLRILGMLPETNGTRIRARWQGSIITVFVPFADSAMLDNACLCWLVMLHLGVPNDIITARMSRLETVAMRLELKAGINDCLVVNDSYNFDLHGLNTALDFVARRSNELQRTIILSDMIHSEQPTETIAAMLTRANFGRVVGIGSQVSALRQHLPPNIKTQFYPDTNTFLRDLSSADFKSEIILLKGARPFTFERIAHRLARKAHKTVLEINLDAIIHNLNVYRSRLANGVKLLAMVKASAYGSGSAEVAKLLEYHGVAYLSVAYTDEGIELRQQGIELPILVLNPEANSLEAMQRYRLEPEIYSLELLREFIAQGITGLGIHLKLDTGMHRLGFEASEMKVLCSLLSKNPQLKICSIFSHLAGSENPHHDHFTNTQVAALERMYAQISAAIGYKPLRHILNSGGIARHPQHQLDMVRLGIGLYGIDSSTEIQSLLQPVHTLKATISQTKNIKQGETIGYSRRGQAADDMRIGTISIGYADGLLRAAGNGKYSIGVAGQYAPIVGNICMDMTMIDLTNIPQAQAGDEVTIFGPEHPLTNLAAALETIPYEVLTGISSRVHRVYFQE